MTIRGFDPLIVLVLLVPVYYFSIFVHELGHALLRACGRVCGDIVRYRDGPPVLDALGARCAHLLLQLESVPGFDVLTQLALLAPAPEIGRVCRRGAPRQCTACGELARPVEIASARASLYGRASRS